MQKVVERVCFRDMPVFISHGNDPLGRIKLQVEREDWEREQERIRIKDEEEKKRERREIRHFWITTTLTAIAALASVVGVILQIVLAK